MDGIISSFVELLKAVRIEILCIAASIGLGLYYLSFNPILCIIIGLISVPILSLLNYLWKSLRGFISNRKYKKLKRIEDEQREWEFNSFLTAYFHTLSLQVQHTILELSKETPIESNYIYSIPPNHSLFFPLRTSVDKFSIEIDAFKREPLITVIENDNGLIVAVHRPILFTIAQRNESKIKSEYAAYQKEVEEYRAERKRKTGSAYL